VELPEVAEIVVVPVATSVATPVLELIFATLAVEELHVGETAVPELFVAKNVTEPEVREAVKVPEPCEIHPVQEIVRLPLLAVPTVRVVVPLTLPELAVITVELPFVAIVETVARPELEIVAMLGAEDVHVTDDRLVLEPLAFVPVAENCSVCPACTDGLLGEIVIDIRVVPGRKNFPHAPARRTGKAITAALTTVRRS